MWFKKYICVKQHDMKDCGAACLATVSRQYGLKIPLTRIREYAGTDLQGTNIKGLVQAADKLGLNAKGVKGTPESLTTELPLPAIAHVVVDQSMLHFVVIHRITEKTILIADPAKGIVSMDKEEFVKQWTGILLLLSPSTDFKKDDQTKGTLIRFVGMLRKQKGILVNIFISSLLYTFLGILGAFYFQFLLDQILPFDLKRSLLVFSIGALSLTVFKMLLNYYRSHLLLLLVQKLDIHLLLGYYKHVVRLPMRFFDTRKTGEVISRLIDASKVRDAISGAALSLMVDTLMVLFGGVILYIQQPFLFGITCILVPIYVGIVWGFQKPFERLNRKQMESHAVLNSYLIESITGIETIKAFRAESKVSFDTERKLVALLKRTFSLGKTYNLQSFLKGIVQAAGGIIILWVGADQVLKGNMSIGQLITFNALLAYFLEPLQNLIDMQSSIQTAVVAADRLGEILDLEVEDADDVKKISPVSLFDEIKFENVNFRYGARQLVLQNLNATIEPGQKVAFVGESGSGKSTLARLLLNMYACESGSISIGHYNVQDIDRDVLLEKISYVAQESFFMSGTIYENLCLGLEGQVDLEVIGQACLRAGAHDFINSLPLRYHTHLEENASNLSGGQRQRLAIARALVKQPEILVLDEATSNLDATTEKMVTNMIHSLQEVTVLVIAHHLQTIRHFDRIFVMDKGQVVETGTHEELMELRGKYFHLWNAQQYEHKEFPQMA